MANGHPKYGGTNGVPALDFGQVGGSLHAAGNAYATVETVVGGDEAVTSTTRLPEIHATYQQVYGYAGTRVVIEGIIRAKGTEGASINEIEENINSYITGQKRFASGAIAAVEERLAPTQLTHGLGLPLWNNARLASYERIGPRRKVTSAPWTELQQMRMVFVVLA